MKTQIRSRMNRVPVDSRQKNDAAGPCSELETNMIREAVKRKMINIYREMERKQTAQSHEEARVFKDRLIAGIDSIFDEIVQEIYKHAEYRIEQVLNRYDKNKDKIDNNVRADCEFVFLRVVAIINTWRDEITIEMEERKQSELHYFEAIFTAERKKAEDAISAEVNKLIEMMNRKLNKAFTTEEALEAYLMLSTEKIENVLIRKWPSSSELETKERGFKRTVYHRIRNELSLSSFERILARAEKGNRWKEFADLKSVL